MMPKTLVEIIDFDRVVSLNRALIKNFHVVSVYPARGLREPHSDPAQHSCPRQGLYEVLNCLHVFCQRSYTMGVFAFGLAPKHKNHYETSVNNIHD